MIKLSEMQTSKWSIMGVLFALGFGLLSSIRYFLLFPDTDRAFVYGLLAVVIIGVSWCYNEIHQIYRKIESLEIKLTDLETWLQDYLEKSNGSKE